MKKRFGAFVLALTLLLPTVAYSAENNTSNSIAKFNDISEHWAKTAILSAVEKGYVSGYEDGAFRPEEPVTRAEFISMAVRALGLNIGSESGSWYDRYISAAREAGFYETQFSQSEMELSIPRVQMARLAVKAAGIKEYKNTTFDDNGYMYLATTNGLLQGMGNGVVAPDEITTRAQAIAVIERILSIRSGKSIPRADKLTRENAEFLWHRTNMYTVLEDYIDLDRTWEGLGYDNFKFETSDGIYKSEITKITVIDLEDKDAIARYKPDLENWIWTAADQGLYYIKDYHRSFIMIVDGNVTGEDGVKYGKRDRVAYTLKTDNPDDDKAKKRFYNGELNSIADLMTYPENPYEALANGTYTNQKRRMLPAKIIPKDYLNHYLTFTVSAPTIAGGGGVGLMERLFDIALKK